MSVFESDPPRARYRVAWCGRRKGGRPPELRETEPTELLGTALAEGRRLAADPKVRHVQLLKEGFGVNAGKFFLHQFIKA